MTSTPTAQAATTATAAAASRRRFRATRARLRQLGIRLRPVCYGEFYEVEPMWLFPGCQTGPDAGIGMCVETLEGAVTAAYGIIERHPTLFRFPR